MSGQDNPAWVEAAAQMPVAFAQVREDPWVDEAVLQTLGPALRICIVASGGCTAAWLAATGRLSHLELVDPNPAQLALTRLKLYALETLSVENRLSLLGHRPMDAGQRRALLSPVFKSLGIVPDILGPLEWVCDRGPDQSGRYEIIFEHLRHELRDVRPELENVLTLTDPKEQGQRVAASAPLGRALDQAFARVMTLPILMRLFGAAATANRVQDFSRHFAQRTRHAFETLPAATNPYLAQVLLGRYSHGTFAPWLTAICPTAMPPVVLRQGAMVETLRESAEKFDLVHLSNILDWLTPDDAAKTLQAAFNALKPGGRVVIRQLNSSLEIAALGRSFDWDVNLANSLLLCDRSFFYRQLYIGRKPAS